jgi:hypothetical protein
LLDCGQGSDPPARRRKSALPLPVTLPSRSYAAV